MKQSLQERFDLSGRVAIITGGLGLLGQQHAEAIASAGGIPVLVDVRPATPEAETADWRNRFGAQACVVQADITRRDGVEAVRKAVLARFDRLDILINNAANNPKMETPADLAKSRFENLSAEQWADDLAVGLTGAFLCCQVLGAEMARRRRGVILNVASDLAVIAPDQRLYRREDLPEHRQPVKPVTYSVVKTGLIGLTRYVATYWADCGVRANAISPGGVYNGQADDFVVRLSSLIPLRRMAQKDEYQAAVVFLCSDASSYMTGNNLIIDGGRTCW
ncbi:MAG: SDR family oxidoreductase [Thermoguttaceae bacterium]|jgi:NAD(P)-dependent dehydrogenase (short-subunit alcohol dehydrogenase family)